VISFSNSTEESFTSFNATGVPLPSKRRKKRFTTSQKKKRERKKQKGLERERVTISSPHFAKISFCFSPKKKKKGKASANQKKTPLKKKLPSPILSRIRMSYNSGIALDFLGRDSSRSYSEDALLLAEHFLVMTKKAATPARRATPPMTAPIATSMLRESEPSPSDVEEEIEEESSDEELSPFETEGSDMSSSEACHKSFKYPALLFFPD
jgi:hypothetical protein